jgi:hypothetical protein
MTSSMAFVGKFFFQTITELEEVVPG